MKLCHFGVVSYERFRVHVKPDPFIREHCDLPRQHLVTAGEKTRENNACLGYRDG
jgi:hypothetical protein